MQIVLTARNKNNSSIEYVLLENEGLQGKIENDGRQRVFA